MSEAQTAAQDTTKAADTSATTEATPAEAKEATKTPEAQTEVKTETPKPQESKPTVPEKYELKLPEGSKLTESHIEKVSAYAKEKGLSQEQAQEVLSRESDLVNSIHEDQKRELHDKVESWVSEIKADKEFGGDKFNETVALANRSIEAFGDPELKKALDDTGLGNHPMIIKMHAKIGRMLADDKFVSSNANRSGEERTEDVLFPSMKK